MTNPDAQKLRREMIDDVRRKAERDFHDTRYDFVRPLGRRRALVVLVFTLLAAYAVLNYFDYPEFVLPVFLLWGVSLWLIRMSTRGIVDYPDEIVDERMRSVRGQTYRYAFMGACVFMSAYMVFYIANQLMAKQGWVLPTTADQMHDLSFCLFFACMSLPSAIYAWNEKLI
ncbi:MAG: hypothetical protein AAFN07_14100 [Pseudomonadota bacterium]